MNRKINITPKSLSIILGIMIISIFTLTIAYAVLSTSLTISGNTQVNASTWDIRITNDTRLENQAIGDAAYTEPTLEGTTIANYSVSLTKPGDAVKLYFRIENYGTINGEVQEIINSTPICESSTNNKEDEKLVCDNLEISFSYISSDNLEKGDVINTSGGYCINGYEEAVCFETLLSLEIKLNNKMTKIPSSTVTISNLKNEIIYTQTNKKCSQAPMDLA